MPTFRETTYLELAHQGYPQETIGQQVSEATRVYLVPWETRQQAALDFLGYSEEDPAGNPPYVQRVIPDSHPGYLRPDGNPYLWADSVTFEPYGQPVSISGNPIYGGDANIDAQGEPVYNQAKMTVHYSSRLYRIFDDETLNVAYPSVAEAGLARYVEMPFGVSAQYLTLPDGTFAFAYDPFLEGTVDIDGNLTTVPAAPTAGSPGKIDAQWDVTLVWRQVPRSMIAAAAVQYPVVQAVQLAAFDYALGHVNATMFAGYPAGTLLCEPMELAQWVQANGEIVFDVTFHFKYYSRGWNYFLQKGTDGKLYYPQIAILNGSVANYYPPDQPPPAGTMLYDSYDFSNLFYGYAYTAGKNPSP